MKLSDLALGGRIYSVLFLYKIETIDQLMALSWFDLQALPHSGVVTASRIHNALRAAGYKPLTFSENHDLFVFLHNWAKQGQFFSSLLSPPFDSVLHENQSPHLAAIEIVQYAIKTKEIKNECHGATI